MINTEVKHQTRESATLTKNAILVIGGAEDKVHGKEILQTFFNRSKSSDAIIGIVPCASREPSLIGERYHRIFSDMGAKEIKVLDVRDRSGANDSAYLDFVENCTGIFLTGGDQLRLCGLLADTILMNRIIERAQKREMSLAGTSAGAAVMGHHMISGGSSAESPNRALVDMAIGLGIIPEVLVDQHFYNRNRLARLLSAVSGHPELLGIGIDEDTCAMFESDGIMEVIGKGTVTIVNARNMTYSNAKEAKGNEPLSMHNLKLHILGYGDRYDLEQNQPYG
ncbi:cyanophycinase [Waterburya agarophytonicola K14]|uniref:Cyanophycinase n=1 Tax=Waterburya agarophytonicola KI4 TaxID=2874699 RepID=A0A964BU96_9CYAN|nr:cyanophycinase [Waterburya agarophytonicola]MCC0178628.1 cyanophycinase [Waterburya agarophytonicola KI4]